MMDSHHPQRVYDPATLRAGGMNADDLTELLRDQPLVLIKEAASSRWDREEQLLAQTPDLILAHRSSFYDATLLGDSVLDTKYFTQLYAPAADKFESLLGYVARANPHALHCVQPWKLENGRRGAGLDRDGRAPLSGHCGTAHGVQGTARSRNIPQRNDRRGDQGNCA